VAKLKKESRYQVFTPPHPAFGKSKLYHLESKTEPRKEGKADNLPEEVQRGSGIATEPQMPCPTMLPSATSVLTPVNDSRATQEGTLELLSASLIAFLESRAVMFQTSEDNGKAWLEATTVQLRQALAT
jgi:hypothetical protein